MNILFISPNSPEISVGGVERYMANLFDYCSISQGNFFFLLPKSKRSEFETKGNLTFYRKDFLTLSYKARKSSGEKEVPQKEIRLKSRAFFDFILSLLDKEKIDCVSAQNFHLGMPPAYSLMLNMACFTHKIPLYLRLHSFSTKPIHEQITNQLFWEKIICVSKSLAGDCFQKGAEINKLRTKYLGVDMQKFKPGNKRDWLRKKLVIPKKYKIILSASRIIEGSRSILKEKGILNLIEAFSKLNLKYKNLKLVISLALPPKRLFKEFNYSLKKLRGYLKLYGVEENTILKSFKLEQMPLVYSGADLFVLPSENETLGQVYLEAMACGLPVIGSKTGGVPEIITHRYNGFLVNPHDSSHLSQKMEEILNNQILRKQFIVNGLKTIRNKFSFKRQFNLLIKLFQKPA